MAVVRENASELKELWRRRIRQAQDAQKPYWGTWATNLAFAAGQHWLVWDEKMSQLRSIKEFDDRYRSREMFTADRITERRQAQIGELSAEDDRPQLLAAQPGEDAEDVTDVLNDLCAYAWDREWDAADVLLRARGMVLDVGYCAIRCRWNPDEGPVAGRVPIGQDGQAVDPNQLAENGMLPDGSLPKFKTVHEGRTEWELYSPFQSLTPPGIVHEKQFPWEALVKPVTIEEVKAVYGVDLDEDTDIVSTIGIPAAVKAGSGQRSNNRLRDHAWLYLCYDRPSRSAPQGRELVFGGPNLELLDVKEGLPYTLDKKPHSGVTYLHWWRLSDRFQSKSFIEGQKDPQRIINRRKTQNVEIIDRSMPKLIVGKGDWPEETTGAPMELIELNPGTRQPIALEGQGPGQWMYQDIESLDEDLVHASTLSNLRLGENPGSVDTYGQLAILNDNEQGKRQAIVGEHRRTIGELVRLSLNDARRYWPPEKIGEVEGDDDQIKQVTFKRDQIPPDVRVKAPAGQPLPRSQGAEIKKIDAIWAAMVQSGFVAADPVAATNWYKDSLEAGKALDLPKASPSTQEQLARLENELMRQGQPVAPSYYDNVTIHIPLHREEQDQARAAEDEQLYQLLEQHIQEHRALALQAAAAAAAQMPPAAEPATQPSQSPPGAGDATSPTGT
jgi:hypothetical protein